MTMLTTRSLPEGIRPASPALQNGDRLSADEFERRYKAMPHVKFELIKGVVYMSSPVSEAEHASPHFDMIGWMTFYRMAVKGIVGGDNATLRLRLNNRPQPDAYLRLLESFGGQSRLSEDGYVELAPELIGEIAASSVNYDLHDKLDVYRENGVREYVVWRVQDRAIDWLILRGNSYERLGPDVSGVYRSEVFPGFWLDPAALMRGDLVTAQRVVQQGLESTEHAAFVSRLSASYSIDQRSTQ